jgi:thiol-disulfide isomerase/thioredoxin
VKPERRGRFASALQALFATLLFVLLTLPAAAQPSARVDVYLFWAFGCPHCEREIEFLKRLEAEESRLRVHYLEVSRDAANPGAFAAAVKRFVPEDPAVQVDAGGRFGDGRLRNRGDERAALRQRIAYCLANECPDTVGPLILRQVAGDGRRSASWPDAGAPKNIPPVISVRSWRSAHRGFFVARSDDRAGSD